MPNACWPSRPFPPEKDARWEKHHDRLERRRIARVDVSPEEVGLVGCWQLVAVKRERIPLDKSKPASCEIGYYATSIAGDQMDDRALSEVIRDHWSAIENGVRHRRDVSFGEDQCRVRNRVAAEMLAVLRNLAIAIHELERQRGHTKAKTLRNWIKSMNFGKAHGPLSR